MKDFNVWNIRNRWLRSAATLGVVVVGAPIYAPVVLATFILVALGKLWEAVDETARAANEVPWRNIGRALAGMELV